MSQQVSTELSTIPSAGMIEQLGGWFARSGLFGCEKAEQGMVLAMACLTEKKSPIQLLKEYHIIQGKLCKTASSMLSDYKKAGGKCQWISGLTDGDTAKARFTFKENDIEVAYTLKDAEREGLTQKGGSWKRNTADMLRARLVSKTLRMIAPEVEGGAIYEPSEIESISAPISQATITTTIRPNLLINAEPEVVVVEETPLQKFSTLVAGKEKLAEKWLRGKKILEKGQGIADTPTAFCLRALSKPEAFIERISE